MVCDQILKPVVQADPQPAARLNVSDALEEALHHPPGLFLVCRFFRNFIRCR